MVQYDRGVEISINCQNAAFEGPNCGVEVVRILKEAIKKIEQDGMDSYQAARYGHHYKLRDINGNEVGYCNTK